MCCNKILLFNKRKRVSIIPTDNMYINSVLDVNCRYIDPKFISQSRQYRLVRCGKCQSCVSASNQKMLTRMDFELRGKVGCSLDLTFRDEPVSQGYALHYVQKFFKRLRVYIERKLGVIPDFKYVVSGEYGSKYHRIHCHAVIIGWTPGDSIQLSRLSARGNPLFKSPIISKLWTHGLVNVREYLHKEQLAYALLYNAKKKNTYALQNKALFNPQLGSIRLKYNSVKNELLNVEYLISKFNLKHSNLLGLKPLSIKQARHLDDLLFRLDSLKIELRNLYLLKKPLERIHTLEKVSEWTTCSKNIGYDSWLRSNRIDDIYNLLIVHKDKPIKPNLITEQRFPLSWLKKLILQGIPDLSYKAKYILSYFYSLTNQDTERLLKQLPYRYYVTKDTYRIYKSTSIPGSYDERQSEHDFVSSLYSLKVQDEIHSNSINQQLIYSIMCSNEFNAF